MIVSLHSMGASASLYGLDAANVHTTAAATDKEFITDFVIGTADGILSLAKHSRSRVVALSIGRNNCGHGRRQARSVLQSPAAARRQVVGSRVFTFRRKRRLIHAVETLPPRRMSAPSIRFTHSRSCQNCVIYLFLRFGSATRKYQNRDNAQDHSHGYIYA